VLRELSIPSGPFPIGRLAVAFPLRSTLHAFASLPTVPRLPVLPPSINRRRRPGLRLLGRTGMTALRWNMEGEVPDLPKFLLIMGPHTSNWDFVIALLANLALDMDAAFMAKHTIFRGPFGTWLRSLGGIPVVRHAAHNVVTQMVAEFRRRDRLILGIMPEGTRRKVARWKSGYWHIARGAGVPIVPAGLDFGRRMIRFGQPLWTSDSLPDDEARLLAFYADITPRYPGQSINA
jgi:1-acyl-sn-glycerol-3-phosphate acyltransferase